jgi:hypothetical protein
MFDMYGATSVAHVQTTESDHCVIKTELRRLVSPHDSCRARPFRYENMWRRHPAYDDSIAASWEKGCRSLLHVQGNLGGLRSVLRRWDI